MEQALKTGGSWGRHLADTALLGAPLIGAQIAQLAINTTDVLIISHLGTVELAAIVLASQFFFTVFILGSGFSTAAIPLATHALAIGDERGVRRSIRMGMWASLAFSLVSIPIFLYSEPILLALGQKPDVAAYAASYLHIAGFGIIPALQFMVLRSFLSALKRASIILYVTVAVLVLNAVFAYIFVLGHFGMPAFGMHAAAYVAAGVNLFGFLAAVVYIERVPMLAAYGLFTRFWRPDWQALGEVVRLGIPVGLMVLAEVSLFTVASLMMGWIGTVELAAHGIALQFASMSFMVPLGLAQAATVRVGLAAGAGQRVEVMRAGGAAVLLATGFAVISCILFIVERESLARLFVDPASSNAAELIATAGPFIIVAGAFQLFDGLQAIGAGLARGLKDSTVPMVLAIASYWGIGFTSAYVLAFPLGFGGIGIWYGFMLGLAAASIALNGRFYYLASRNRLA
ncbi:multidrug resistance protein, MATE family [Ensifer adhaerens]|nr:multidrug resistance protein, MATE family [Ensifer adhaerens]